MKLQNDILETVFQNRKLISKDEVGKSLEAIKPLVYKLGLISKGRIRKSCMKLETTKDILTLLRRISRRQNRHLFYRTKNEKIGNKWKIKYYYGII